MIRYHSRYPYHVVQATAPADSRHRGLPLNHGHVRSASSATACIAPYGVHRPQASVQKPLRQKPGAQSASDWQAITPHVTKLGQGHGPVMPGASA